MRAEVGEDAEWSVEAHLIAFVCELLDRNYRQLIAMTPVDEQHESTKQRALKAPPLQIPRPGMERSQKRKGTTLGELTGMMGGTEV